jgi:hypothetical protein
MTILVVHRETLPNASIAILYRHTSGTSVAWVEDLGVYHVKYNSIRDLLGDPAAEKILEAQSRKRRQP